MFGTQDFAQFLVAVVILNLIPGPDTMYIIGRSIAQGRRAGYLSVLGISSGSLVHAAAAAFGLSVILVSSATAFAVVKWVGAAYLVYLGVQMLCGQAAKVQVDSGEVATANLWVTYRQALVTNLFNPKVAIFFMALLPQFVAPVAEGSPWPLMFLGSVFIVTGTVWCLLVAAMAAKVSKVLRNSQKTLAVTNKITGIVFIALGIRVATQQAR